MNMSKEHFNGVYSTIFESVGERVIRDIHSKLGGNSLISLKGYIQKSM